MLSAGINTLAFVDIDPAERGHVATAHIDFAIAGDHRAALLLAAAQAYHAGAALNASDFQIAFVGVALIGLFSLLPYLRPLAQDGHELIGIKPGR